MKSVTRRPAKRRSQTRTTHRPRRRSPNAISLPARLSRAARPLLGVQRGAATVAIAGLLIMLLFVFVSPDYRIKTIEIKGNRGVATQDVEEAVSFVQGLSAFLVRTDYIEQAVKTLPGVEKVDARVVLPNRLEVTLTDSRPDVAWIVGTLIWWVDDNGYVHEQVGEEPERRITVNDLSGRMYNKGDRIDKAALSAALQLNVAMQSDIAAFEFTRPGEITVVSQQGWRAIFNAHSDLTQQQTALRRILDSGRSVAVVDVRVPGRVIVN